MTGVESTQTPPYLSAFEVERENAVAKFVQYRVQPSIEQIGKRNVTPATNEFNPSPHFSYRCSRQVKRRANEIDLSEKIEATCIGSPLVPQFTDDIGVN